MGKVSQSSQYLRADKLIEIVCKVGNVSYAKLVSREKNLQLCILRGLIYYYSRELSIHPSITASLILRTRCNVITMCQRYGYYVRGRDKSTIKLSDEIEKKIREEKLKDL